MKLRHVCSSCGSDEVFGDAWASWDEAKQEWVLENIYDNAYCNICEHETSLDTENIE